MSTLRERLIELLVEVREPIGDMLDSDHYEDVLCTLVRLEDERADILWRLRKGDALE